jgi:putative flippase GtrA
MNELQCCTHAFGESSIRARLQSCGRAARTGKALPPAVRWFKFNLVGLGGALVQLGLLEAWMHFSLGNYLLGTAVAVEGALFHNFGWHCIYTWRDRPAPTKWAVLLRGLRFHLSNGAVSLFGNLALMHLLVGALGIPALLANIVAILACSIVNFLLGHCWVFEPPG